MSKVQYSGLSDTRIIAPNDTILGAVPAGIGVGLTFSRANNFTIDFTQAPYTGCAAATFAALIALPNGEFVDVTTASKIQSNLTTYPIGQTGVASAPGHVVSSGALPGITSLAGATVANVGPQGANDAAGEVVATTLATGNVANTPLIGVTFATPYASAPKNVDITAGNAATEAIEPYAPVASVTTTGFVIQGNLAAAASSALIFTYAVTG